MLHQQVWARDPTNLGKKHSRHQKETKDKESQRWLTALEVTENVMPQSTTVVTVADREVDFWAGKEMVNRESRPRKRGLQRLHDLRCYLAISFYPFPPYVKPDFVKKDVSKA